MTWGLAGRRGACQGPEILDRGGVESEWEEKGDGRHQRRCRSDVSDVSDGDDGNNGYDCGRRRGVEMTGIAVARLVVAWPL